MIRLTESLLHWGRDSFEATFRREVLALDPSLLPLQEGLTRSSHALGDDIEVILLGRREEADAIEVIAGLFYKGIIAGCSCADDPTPVDEITEYCEVRFLIDRRDAATRVYLLPAGQDAF
ncbi:MAG: hypothetical protein DSZ00_03420 [Gammaproteobacteria bacterium]|nr:MAG: hypothetical protein DSZ02_05290 [Gammaproteobacteria bacterium]RTZ74845.1 MAG: hypothetical protein DSZ00_03420 [Gammaproteobacteria bacterium]